MPGLWTVLSVNTFVIVWCEFHFNFEIHLNVFAVSIKYVNDFDLDLLNCLVLFVRKECILPVKSAEETVARIYVVFKFHFKQCVEDS